MNEDRTERITRSQTDRMIAGVCGGLADYLRIDSTLVRIFFVLLALGDGIGVLLYVILWLIMPEEGQVDRTVRASFQSGAAEMGQQAWSMGGDLRRAATRPNRQIIVLIGAVLIFLGVVYLVDNLNIPGLAWLDVSLLWPILMILGGIALLVRRGG